MSRSINLAVIPGDGIGQEVVAHGLKVLNAVLPEDVKLETKEYDLGARRWHRTGETLPDAELEALKDQNARLKADNVALVTQLRMMNTSVTNEMRGIQEGTLNWVLSKFWLRRRLSFKTVATAITAMVALQRRVRAGAAGGSCPPLPKGRKAKTAAKTVAGGRRQLQPQEEPPKKKLRRQTSRRLA